MNKPLQKRAQATRAKLVKSAEHLVALNGFGALRVEQVVQDAGVAKGTFFAHFQDKDMLMDNMVGAKIDAYLEEAQSRPAPETVGTLVTYLMPLINFMTCERYVFDLILRHSGAAAKQQIGPIAMTFDRQIGLLTQWISDGPFRKDQPALLLAEGVQAFVVQSMALNFCAINSDISMQSRLLLYLDAWLSPQTV